MRGHIKFVLIALVLQTTAIAADAKGWFEGDCSGTSFQVAKFPGSSAREELIMRWTGTLAPDLLADEGWLNVQAKRWFRGRYVRGSHPGHDLAERRWKKR
jgi:hypothetical protein